MFTCRLLIVAALAVALAASAGSGRAGTALSASSSSDDFVSATGSATAIATTWAHNCALTNAGGVKCWGYNESGQLGDGATSARSTPVDVSGLSSGVTAIATGGAHSCALTNAGGVKCWGLNLYGQLGDGTTTDRSMPVDVSGLRSGVTAIAAGSRHSCALTNAGGVKCWGLNDSGQLGDGTTSNRSTPVNVSGLRSGVTAIATGFLHSCALTNAGGVKCWGDNDDGQLGDGTRTYRRTPVGVIGFGAAARATLAIVSRSVTVTPARIAAVKLSCGSQARCRGTLTLAASGNRKKLATRTFLIAAGRTQAVKVKLTAGGFKLLLRVKRLPARVRISYRQPAGGTTTTSRTITLVAPKGLVAQTSSRTSSEPSFLEARQVSAPAFAFTDPG